MADDTTAGTAPAGGGTAPSAPAEAKFTQADLDRMIAGRFSKHEKELAAAKAEAEAARSATAEVETLRKQVEELELKGKSAEERERIAAEKAAKAIQSERDNLQKQLATVQAERDAEKLARRQDRMERLIGDAYDAAKGLQSMRRHAVPAFLRDVEIDYAEDGTVAGVRLDGVARKDVADAMGAWLTANDGFRAAAGGGSGSGKQSSNGAGGLPADASASALIAAGLREGT